MVPFVAVTGYQAIEGQALSARAASFYDEVRRRRTVRDFSDRPVPREVVGVESVAVGVESAAVGV